MDKDLIYPLIWAIIIILPTIYLYSIDKKPTIKMIFPWLISLIILGIGMVSHGTSIMDAVISTSIAILIPLLIWIAYVKGKFEGFCKGASKLCDILGKLADATVYISQGLFILVIALLLLYFLFAFSWVFGGIFGVIFAIFWLWGMLRN